MHSLVNSWKTTPPAATTTTTTTTTFMIFMSIHHISFKLCAYLMTPPPSRWGHAFTTGRPSHGDGSGGRSGATFGSAKTQSCDEMDEDWITTVDLPWNYPWFEMCFLDVWSAASCRKKQMRKLLERWLYKWFKIFKMCSRYAAFPAIN